MKLLDEQLEIFLKENGFCKYDLKAKDILPELERIYQKHYLNNSEKDFFVTHNTGNGDKVYQIHQELCRVCEPVISNHWEDYEIFAAHFVVKKAKSESSFQLHQDWNNVEESEGNSVQIWIPLEFSYPENGGLGFLAKSHLFFKNYRSGSYDIPRIEVEPKLYPYLSYLRLFPGESAFFYNNTFHCSFINSTEKDRVAVLLNIAPKGARNIYCHKNGDTVEKYSVTSVELYNRLHLLEKGEAPEGLNLVEKSDYRQSDNSKINADDLIQCRTELNERHGLPADYEAKQYHIIRDESIEKEINHRGYKIIDFLTDREVKMLLDLFPKYFPDRSLFKGRYSTMDSLPMERTLEAHQDIQRIIQPRIEYFFKEAYSPVSLLYSKNPDGVLDIDWHSDPSFILNESLEPIYGIWCSLLDINALHGSLKIVPGGHRFIRRLLGTPFTWQSPLLNHWRKLDKYGVQSPLKPGQAFLYDARMIHSSTPNMSDLHRDCVVMRITSNKVRDFFSILMDTEEPMKGYVYRQSENYFFGNEVKIHKGDLNLDTAEGSTYFFDYSVTEQEIERYFSQFKK